MPSFLFQISGATCDDDAKRIAMTNCDILVNSGVTKPLSNLTLADVPLLVQCAARDNTILRIKSELDQVTSGLCDAGTLQAIRKYPDFFEPMFVASDRNSLSAGRLYVQPTNLYVLAFKLAHKLVSSQQLIYWPCFQQKFFLNQEAYH